MCETLTTLDLSRSDLTMLEALREARSNSSLWARPTFWRGVKQAITFDTFAGSWKTVPDSRGGRSTLLPMPKDCFGDWEVVTPEVVNEGR